MLSVVLIGLCVLCMCITEDGEGETDAGEEPVEPAKVENVSQCFCFMPEGLQWSKSTARAAAGVSQVHLPRLPSVLFLSSHRHSSLTAWVATPAIGVLCGCWTVYDKWGSSMKFQQGHSHWTTLTLDTEQAHWCGDTGCQRTAAPEVFYFKLILKPYCNPSHTLSEGLYCVLWPVCKLQYEAMALPSTILIVIEKLICK